jgi:hypothetical protein
MISEAVSGLTALKTALDMAKALKDINDATLRNAAVIELQEKILSAQEAQFALKRRVDELERQLSETQKRNNQLARYEFKNYGDGSFAYELKASEAYSEPSHRVCANCYQDGHISILQFSNQSEGQDWFNCLRGQKHQHFGARIPQEYRRPGRHSDFEI